MNLISSELAPAGRVGRWHWPDPDCECVRMLRQKFEWS